MIEQKEFEKLSWEDTVEKIVNLPEEEQLEGLLDLAVWLRNQLLTWKQKYNKEAEEKDNCLRCIESLTEDNKELKDQVDELRDRIHKVKIREQNTMNTRVRDATEWTKLNCEIEIKEMKKKFLHMKCKEIGVLSVSCIVLGVLVLTRQGNAFSNAHLFFYRIGLVIGVIKDHLEQLISLIKAIHMIGWRIVAYVAFFVGILAIIALLGITLIRIKNGWLSLWNGYKVKDEFEIRVYMTIAISIVGIVVASYVERVMIHIGSHLSYPSIVGLSIINIVVLNYVYHKYM